MATSGIEGASVQIYLSQAFYLIIEFCTYIGGGTGGARGPRPPNVASGGGGWPPQ